MEWKNLYRGLMMGISDLIPGVSGGTIAVVLGIYDRLLQAISGFFSREWKRHIGFLIPLALGMGTAILLLSRVIEYVLEHYFAPTQFFFIGLVLGVLPMITRQAGDLKGFRPLHIVSLILAAILLAALAFVQGDQSAAPITDLNAPAIAGLFLAGALASTAMLLPGISGSLVLLLLGVYPTAIYALSNLHFPLIAIIGAGVLIGFVASSKGIRYLLRHYAKVTHAVTIGLLAGSTIVMFPGIPEGPVALISSLITLACGFALTFIFGAAGRTQTVKRGEL